MELDVYMVKFEDYKDFCGFSKKNWVNTMNKQKFQGGGMDNRKSNR